MKRILFILGMTVTMITLTNCSRLVYSGNGEKIYLTGENMQGLKLLDKNKSELRLFKSCKSCHGKTGASFKGPVIQWSVLSNPAHLPVPYTDSLFFRFLDHDLKSDGTPANIGVHWSMNDKDKQDLLDYLKTL